MEEDLSTLNLGDRFVKVLELLDGLSTKEISCLLANIEHAVRDKGTIKIEGVRPEQFNSDIRGTF